jgi:hypothetical protein
MIVIVPSRGRPKRAANMVASVRQTASKPVRIVVAVDPDDPFLDEYRRKVRETLVLPERRYYSGALNIVASEVWDDEDILGAFGDDVLFRTKGWDDLVRESLATPGIAFPNDLAHGSGWPTAVWMSSSIARALGWLAYPGVTHQYVDNVWKVVGEDLGVLRYLPDVVCEHMHVAYGKADWDPTYHDVYGERAPADHVAFDAWMANGRERDVERAR